MVLGEHFLESTYFCEHHAVYNKHYRISDNVFKGFDGNLPKPILFKGRKKDCCFAINDKRQVENGYFIGVDWITKNKAVYVQPKLNRRKRKKDADTFREGEAYKQVNYLAMLFSALQHPDVFEHTADLFEIKWDKPEIKINQQQDMLTPLLVLQFLQIVKNIVRKGLKKSYYKVEQNLRNRVKGKVLVTQNIKQNLAKSKSLDTYCAYEEFGYNGIENRILKKALVFVERYLPAFQGIGNKVIFTHTFNYIRPAFEQVSAEASLHDCRHIKVNPLYKEYLLAIDLAKQILRRFGYNIQNTSEVQISTPPFWIDMSKLFELYVLGLLKDNYNEVGTIDFQFGNRANKLDFLLDTPDFRGVVDAKYKLKYQKGKVGHDDIRQVSGYARLLKVYKRLGKTPAENQPHVLIDCLIIYPDGYLEERESYKLDLIKRKPIEDYAGILKCGVKLPVMR